MATDPAGGMQVDERTVVGISIFEGSSSYVRSAGCKKKFDANAPMTCAEASIISRVFEARSLHGISG